MGKGTGPLLRSPNTEKGEDTMIKSVGIDLAGTGEHKVRCLDERAQVCAGLTFQTTPEGLSKLEERVFRDGSNPVTVFEPTGLAWLMVAIYLKGRHPDCHLVRVQARKVVALRKYLRRSSKSDKIDALTLAKMPFIDSEQLEEIYLPPQPRYTPYSDWLARGSDWSVKSGLARRESGLSWTVISQGCGKHSQTPGLPMPELSFGLV